MIDYLGSLKKNLSKIFAIYHFCFTLVAAVFILITLQKSSLKIIISIELIYLIVAAIFYFLIRNIFERYIVDKLGSQETISRSIFKNTRMVINNISHEIRTPLNAIMGFANDLVEVEKDEKKLEGLTAITDNSERLFNMAKKLIDFSSIETGQFKIEIDYCSNDSLLLDLTNKYQREIDKKALDFNLNNNIPENYRLKLDYNAVFEILEMLLENAIKFTDKGSISINSFYNNGILNYIICDTGRGIPDDKKELIFQLYRQGNSNMDREYEGIGLGLTIADKLTQMLGGTINLSDNSDNIGSCFHVKLEVKYKEIKSELSTFSDSLIPKNLSESDLVSLKESTLALSEYIKVFNPDKIREIANDLGKQGDGFLDLSQLLIKIADTYSESEFSHIVDGMLKGIEDEG